MERNRKKQKERGITLVALIITIIVMLILVAVTVRVVVESDIIRVAEEAGEITKDAYESEQELLNEGINIEGMLYDSLENYVNHIPSEKNYEIVSEEITGTDEEFKYVKLKNEAIQITRYIGEETEVTIPAEYEGYKVFSIGNIEAGTESGKRYNIFGETSSESNTTIKSIEISEGIRKIGLAAFSGCKGLECNLVLPSTLIEIDDLAFNMCFNIHGEEDTENLIIPEGVTKIGDMAFQGYGYNPETGRKTVTGKLILPSTLKELGDRAFYSCSGLTGDLIIPKGVTKIGKVAFELCSGFDGKLELPSTLTEIGEYAFNSCSGLTGDLVIPEGITIIERTTFQNCSGFGKLILPSKLTEIGENAFKNCSGLTGELNIPEGVTIGENAFSGCTGLTGNI